MREAHEAGAEPDAGARGTSFYSSDFIDAGAPAHFAASIGASEAVLQALVDIGADLDAADANGDSPLTRAIGAGHPETAGALLDLGAGPNGGPDRPFLGLLPVHHAAIAGDAATTARLLALGATPEATTNATMGYGYNALGYAIHYGHAAVVELLLDAGLTTEFVGETGGTALDLALARDWPAVVELLRRRGAKSTAEAARSRAEAAVAGGDPWAKALREADVPLMRALLDLSVAPPTDAIRRAVFELRDASDLVGRLAAAGADVDAAGYGGGTALHEAAANAFPELVHLLLAAGADPTVRNDAGETPLDLARQAEDPETIRLLSES